jgi:arginine repressor
MSSKPVWNFRPTEKATEVVERIEENVHSVESRSDAINLLLQLQAELVESGGMDMIFALMAEDDAIVVTESEHQKTKAAVKEAIREIEAEGAVEGREDG